MTFRKFIQKPGRKPGLAVLGLLFLVSCHSNKPETGENYVKVVKTAAAKKISSDTHKQFPAILEEAEEVNLAFRVAGPIQKIYVKEGDYVKKGQLVAEMDTRDYEVQFNAIEAQVSQLQNEYRRIEELKNRQSVAINDFEKMKAGKEMAEAKLKNAKDMLNDTRLFAPFSGYITKVNFEDGSLVNHGTPVATMIDISQLKVEINVPASLFIQKDKIKTIVCTQNEIPGECFPLTLYSNNIKANNNGLYKFYLYHNPASGSKLVPGMNVLVHITCENEGAGLLSIPSTALFEKENASYVWVVADGKVKSRRVETNNLVNHGNVGIVSGLSENETVVIGGLNLLADDQPVNAIAPASSTNVGNLL